MLYPTELRARQKLRYTVRPLTDSVKVAPKLHQHLGPYAQRRRGSSASHSPSPSRLKPNTVRKIAMPGSAATCGATLRYCRLAASMLPQSDVGGWTPRPRKDSPACTSKQMPRKLGVSSLQSTRSMQPSHGHRFSVFI